MHTTTDSGSEDVNILTNVVIIATSASRIIYVYLQI